MDQDFHRLLYRNAELETELRLVKEQLNQANDANTYLLGQISRYQPAYQIPRALPTPHFTYPSTSVQPEDPDLLSFDEVHDSGHGEPLTPSPTPHRITPAYEAKHVPKGRPVEEEVVEIKKSSRHGVQANLIDHEDSRTPPPESLPEKIDFKSLRKRPSKDCFGRGILNVYNDRMKAKGVAENAEPADEDGFIIIEHHGKRTFVPTGDYAEDYAPAKDQEVEVIQETIQAEEQEAATTPEDTQPKEQEQIPEQNLDLEALPPAPPAPSAYPYPRAPRGPCNNNNGGLFNSRWSPHRNPNNNYGPTNITDLFTTPVNPDSHTLYRTVQMTNLPLSTTMPTILSKLNTPNVETRMIDMPGMKTVPPIETRTAMLTFPTSVDAAKFVDRCNTEWPWEFEADVHLMRTGTGGEVGKEKFVPSPDREQGRGRYVQVETQQRGGEGFERGGRGSRMEREVGKSGREESEVERDGEVVMREA